MLIDQGVRVDECYTAMWRESKYTLIHCAKADRITLQALKFAMESLQKLHGISLNATILSYDALSSNDSYAGESLEVHPGFKRIVHLLNSQSTDLKWWIAEGNNVHEYRKGMLWKYIETTDPMKMTHGQLAARVISWKPIVEESEKMRQALEVMNPTLQRHIETKPPPSTHTILTKYRMYKPLRDVMKKVGKVSKKLNKTPSHDCSGEIYAAVNPLMQHLYKMGFTFKDAETRVSSLQTAGVLEPFKLIRRAKVADAR
jgi:hypothetical protein